MEKGNFSLRVVFAILISVLSLDGNVQKLLIWKGYEWKNEKERGEGGGETDREKGKSPFFIVVTLVIKKRWEIIE